MKSEPEYVEGPEAFSRFQNAMRKVISVPHAVVQRKIEEHRAAAAANPNRPGPKPKKVKRRK
jgi:hypothetical protein